MSTTKINELLAIMASIYDNNLPFHSHKHMYDTIDATTHGDSPWQLISVTYSGAIPDNPPPWMTAEYDVWYRDPKVVLEHQLANPDFKGEVDYSTKVVIDEGGRQEVCDLMSGQWAFEQSISNLFQIVIQVSYIDPCRSQDIIVKDADMHGAMFVPVVLGSDKTTVSVATGHTEYYPLYILLENIHNNVRRVHRDAVTILAFLVILSSLGLLW